MNHGDQLKKLYFCGDLAEELSQEEARNIVHMKRFLECMVGDKKFRNEWRDSPDRRERLLSERGIMPLDVNQLNHITPDAIDNQIHIDDEVIDSNPLLRLWKKWGAATTNYRETVIDRANHTSEPAYKNWRSRQKRRSRSELGTLMDSGLVHALAAFELNLGCSMNCPFCGISAPPLNATFEYTAGNSRLWNEIIQLFKERFGSASETGFCYWATDPSDNPDYLKFVKDFGDITGVYPQTTTAAPMRNLEWTRQLLKFRQEHPTAADRFSILSVGSLRKVHKEFTPEELSLLELVCINPDSLQIRTNAGRNLEPKIKKKNQLDIELKADEKEEALDGTIACVSGFLVNMVERSIKLISPYQASQKYPKGYRIFAEGHFNNVQDVSQFLDHVIRDHMSQKLPNDSLVAFREDLKFIPLKNGFHLKSAHFLHKMTGAQHLLPLGKLINETNRTAGELIGELVAQGENVFALSNSLKEMFDNGFFEPNYQSEERPVRIVQSA